MLLEWQILFPYRGLIVLFVIQLLSSDWLFVTPWTAARQTSLSFTISWSLFKLMSIELVMPSNHLILYFPLFSCPQPLPASGSFPKSHLFASGGKNIGASPSESVLPMNIQGCFPFRLTGLISLMLLNCGAREDSWESLGQQGDQVSQSQRKSTLNTQWKDWCWR